MTITPEGRARLEKYGSTLDAYNVQQVIDRIADYPEIIAAVGRLIPEPDNHHNAALCPYCTDGAPR